MDLNSLSARRQVSPAGAGRAATGRSRAAHHCIASLCDSPTGRNRGAIHSGLDGGMPLGQALDQRA